MQKTLQANEESKFRLQSIRRKISAVSTGEWHHWREETIVSIHLLGIITYFSTDNLEKTLPFEEKKIHQMQPIPTHKDLCSHIFIFKLNTTKHGRRPAERSTPSRQRFPPSNRRVKTSEHPHLIPCPLRLHPQLVWTPTECYLRV
jgi:hypothetical protein